MVAGVTEYFEHFAGDLTVFQIHRVGDFVGIRKSALFGNFAFVPIVINLFQFLQFSVVLQSGTFSDREFVIVIFLAVVVCGIVTGYVFDHTVGISDFNTLLGKHVQEICRRRITEYSFDGVCGITVLPIISSVVLRQVSESVLAPCGVAFAGYGAETVIVSVIPCFARQQPVVVFFIQLFFQSVVPPIKITGIINLCNIVIGRLTVVDHVRQHRDVDGRVLCVVFRFVLVFVYTGKQTYHDDRQHQNACQYFENFAFHFGSPLFTDTSRA